MTEKHQSAATRRHERATDEALKLPPLTVNQHLDAAKDRQGLPSDYALAKLLQVSTSRISNYRTGRAVPDDYIAVILSRITGEHPMRVIRDFRLERAQRSGNPAKVERVNAVFGFAKRAAMALLVAGTSAFSPPPAQAAAEPAGKPAVCIMSNRRRRWLDALFFTLQATVAPGRRPADFA